jgi:hypothetical protein
LASDISDLIFVILDFGLNEVIYTLSLWERAGVRGEASEGREKVLVSVFC